MQGDLQLLQSQKSVKKKRAQQQLWSVLKKASIAASLVTLTALLLPRFFTEDFPKSKVPEVNDLLEQGNLALREKTPNAATRAERFFRRAVELDPGFVPAHFGVAQADIHLLDGAHMADLRATAEKLAELAPDSAETLHIAAFIKWREGRWQEAKADAKRATQARAYCLEGRAWAHVAYGFFLQNTGDPEGALREYRIGADLYPAEPTILDHLGHPYLMRSNLVEALKQYQLSLDLQPAHPNGLYWKGRTLEEMGRFEEAIQVFGELDRVNGEYDAKRETFYVGLRNALREHGADGYWRYRLDEMLKWSPESFYTIATLYARLQETKTAYEYLERAAAKHDTALENLLFDLCWDRTDEHLKDVARKIGLLH
jgi:tetratricopeptide (TPR) repeat protein